MTEANTNFEAVGLNSIFFRESQSENLLVEIRFFKKVLLFWKLLIIQQSPLFCPPIPCWKIYIYIMQANYNIQRKAFGTGITYNF